jgi:hypothetical protein
LKDLVILSLVAPIQFEAPVILSLLVFRFLLEAGLKLGGNHNLGGNIRMGDNLNLGGNLQLEDITQFMGNVYPDYNLNLGIFLFKGINNRVEGNIVKLILLCPLISDNCIKVL